ncbi:MAG: FMN-binding negative transcriptional regulator [Gammaproteobacteria bacterium]|nr:FMN-binding negative transcriptional regulator [Gammaproteobacteria bacterium]
MYVPEHFKEEDVVTLLQYIRDYSFGTLIVADKGGIEANHVPFYLADGMQREDRNTSIGKLQCHVARNNPVWKKIADGAQVLVVFQGPNAYISPSWYITKKETGRVVPTWNYLAVHAEGCARAVDDPAWLRAHVCQLTNQNESHMNEPWAVDDAPTDYTQRLVQAIVGIEIEITTLKGKLKASQNQPERNRAGVKAGLEAQEATHITWMSGLID